MEKKLLQGKLSPAGPGAGTELDKIKTCRRNNYNYSFLIFDHIRQSIKNMKKIQKIR